MSLSAFAAPPFPTLRKRPRTPPHACTSPTTSHVVTVDGASLLRRVTTPPAASRTAVLLHDFMTDHRIFTDLTTALQSLAPDHRTVAYDMRGFGKSDNPTEALYSALDDLQCVAGPVSHPLDLVAVGFGGPIALEYALARAANVRSVCCIGSGLPGHRWAPQAMLDITEARDSALRQTLMNKLDRRDAAPSGELVKWKHAFIKASVAWTQVIDGGDPDVARTLLEMARDYGGFRFFREEKVEPNAFGGMPLAKRLGGVDAPVLVMVGEGDTRDFHQIAGEIWDGVANGWAEGVVAVPECGHFAVVEQYQAVAEQIAAFWAAQEGAVQTDGVEGGLRKSPM